MRNLLLAARCVCVAAALLTISTVFASPYTARLYFRNETTGEDGPGAVSVIPGQVVSLNWSFHQDPAASGNPRWTILQAIIDLASADASAILTDEDANQWDALLASYFSGNTYPVCWPWQPTDGPIYDDPVHPGNSTQPLITEKGIYLLVGCSGSTATAQNVDASFFQFTVGAGALSGTELHWALPGRGTPYNSQYGLVGTVFYDNLNKFHDPTDNYLVVADGPVSRLSGHVGFSDHTGGPPGKTVDGVLTRNGQAAHPVKVRVNADGTYAFPLLSDGYTLSVQTTHWLRKKIAIDAKPGDVTGLDFQLVNGDAYQDGDQAGRVNLQDLSWVLLNCDSPTPGKYADLDDDGTIGLLDLAIVIGSFGLVANSP